MERRILGGGNGAPFPGGLLFASTGARSPNLVKFQAEGAASRNILVLLRITLQDWDQAFHSALVPGKKQSAIHWRNILVNRRSFLAQTSAWLLPRRLRCFLAPWRSRLSTHPLGNA
jgi:hypothetical protein